MHGNIGNGRGGLAGLVNTCIQGELITELLRGDVSAEREAKRSARIRGVGGGVGGGLGGEVGG